MSIKNTVLLTCAAAICRSIDNLVGVLNRSEAADGTHRAGDNGENLLRNSDDWKGFNMGSKT